MPTHAESERHDAAGWRPIETAPKDGASILVAGGDYWCVRFEEPLMKCITKAAQVAWNKCRNRWEVCDTETQDYCADYIDGPQVWQPVPEWTPGESLSRPDPVIEAVVLLRELEWHDVDGYGDANCCPVCMGCRHGDDPGHADTCKLGRFLETHGNPL